ncbi:MAG: hypothetical protein EYC70_07705 [Planctomycetota bacterium]|nr:MAG: hypothetical protein EYC70_07705 [Planctomycetota bacterium]
MNRQEKGPLLLLYERLYVLILVTAAAVAAAFLISRTVTPMYRGQSRGFLPTTADAINIRSEEGNLPTGPKLPVASTEMQDSLKGVARSAMLREQVANALPEVNYQYLEKNVDADIDKFNLLVFTAWHPEAETAARIANTSMQMLQDMLRDINQRGVAATVAVLGAQIEATQARLASEQQQQLDFLRASNTVDYGSEFQSLAARIDRLRQALSDLDVQIGTLDDEVAATTGQLAARKLLLQDGAFILSSQAQVRNVLINTLRQEIAQQEIKLSEMLKKYTVEHPLVKAEQERMAQLERQLAVESAPENQYEPGSRSFTLDSIASTFEQQLYQFEIQRESLRAQREERQRELDAALAQWRAMPDLKAQLDLMDQRIADTRGTLGDEMARLEEFRVFQARKPDYIQITERAVPDTEPKYPSVTLNMAVAAILGLIISVVLIVIMDRVSYHRERAPW